MTRAAPLMLASLLVAIVGCGKKAEEPAPSPKTAVPAVPKPEPAPKTAPKAAAPRQAEGFHTAILAAMSKAGLKVGVLEQTAPRPYNAKACVQGDVEQLDVLLCSFDGEAAATAAEKTAEQFLGGATTGVVRRRGSVVIAVADRKKTDLRGQQISKLLQAFAAPSS